MKKLPVGAILVMVGVLALGGYRFYGPRRVPEGQPELVHLNSESVSRLRDDFNTGADGTRVLALLSPT